MKLPAINVNKSFFIFSQNISIVLYYNHELKLKNFQDKQSCEIKVEFRHGQIKNSFIIGTNKIKIFDPTQPKNDFPNLVNIESVCGVAKF